MHLNNVHVTEDIDTMVFQHFPHMAIVGLNQSLPIVVEIVR